jgi:hypothetical protein
VQGAAQQGEHNAVPSAQAGSAEGMRAGPRCSVARGITMVLGRRALDRVCVVCHSPPGRVSHGRGSCASQSPRGSGQPNPRVSCLSQVARPGRHHDRSPCRSTKNGPSHPCPRHSRLSYAPRSERFFWPGKMTGKKSSSFHTSDNDTVCLALVSI